MPKLDKTLGQIGFEASQKDLLRNASETAWKRLSVRMKENWEAAAAAIKKACQKECKCKKSSSSWEFSKLPDLNEISDDYFNTDIWYHKVSKTVPCICNEEKFSYPSIVYNAEEVSISATCSFCHREYILTTRNDKGDLLFEMDLIIQTDSE